MKPMELVWKQLLNTMAGMTKHSQGLIDLALRQREAVVREDVQTVGQCVIEQEHAMADFQALEQERQALLADLARQLQVPEPELNSRRLLSLVPPDWSNAYRAQMQALRESMERVKREHEINRKLINHSREFVGWLIQFLVTPEGSAPVYDAMGAKAQKSYYHVVNQAL
jgi:hypothetical protein